MDQETKEVSGCPARAPSVIAVLDAIETKASAKGEAATCNHAKTITIEDLQMITRRSQDQCPHEKVTPEGAKSAETVDDLKFITKHGMMRAFSSMGFTLWTR